MKYLAKLIVASVTALVCFTGSVHAKAISSDAVMQAQQISFNKQQLIEMVNRADVQQKLVSLGVDQSQAIERINAMTPAEITQLNQHLFDAPAGGIVSAVLTVLAVIAILDLVGVTDVYPFIRPINS